MKRTRTLLAAATSGCLAVALYAAQSQAEASEITDSSYCNYFSWWGSAIDNSCPVANGSHLHAWATGATGSDGIKRLYVNIDTTDPLPTSGHGGFHYWVGDLYGVDSSGNLIGGCRAIDYDPSVGQSAVDNDGCENATGVYLEAGYKWGPIN